MSVQYRGVRKNICHLIDEYDNGNTTALDELITAFQYIQQLPTDDYNSFFKIAGYHGQPFRGAGWGNSSWWGGYCHHGNVLFPTWHRAYLMQLENALRLAPGCSDVTLPYWDETSSRTADEGLPRIFLDKTYTFGDDREPKTINNPLRSYTFQADAWDNTNDGNYTKSQGYETVRYPFSGLMGPDDEGTTEQHNKLVSLLDDNGTDSGTDKLLNDNVKTWLGSSITMKSGQTFNTHTAVKYEQCLLADNYTVFSNITSATAWNEERFHTKKWPATSSSASKDLPVVPLESPHNDVHLAIGGFDMGGDFSAGWVAGANGDMGENNTAGFDPIFYFHHCFIDKKFWEWQQKHGSTNELEIIPEYPGTNSVDSQGPTPGVPGNVWLTMDTPLAPFKNEDGTPRTSKDVVNILTQLGYQYPTVVQVPVHGGKVPKPFPTLGPHLGLPKGEYQLLSSTTPIVRVSGLNRASIPGSFVVVVRALVNGEEQVVGTESVLSRWEVSGCANCQLHLGVKAFIPLIGLEWDGSPPAIQVGVQTRRKASESIGGPLKPNWHFGEFRGDAL